jgi:hypothetical protein
VDRGYAVRRVQHRDGRESYWIFTPDGDLHRPSLNVLKRYGTSTQETYAYSLVDHLNWLRVNHKTPNTVTFDDLQHYMNGLTGQSDDVYGAVWRRPEQRPLGPSAAGNVATVVKAYYLALPTSEKVSSELIDGLTAGGAVGESRRRVRVAANPLAPRKSARRPRFLPDQFVEALISQGC